MRFAIVLLASACSRTPPTTDPDDSGASDTDTPDTDTDPTFSGPSFAVTVIGFNVESGGADAGITADDLVAPIVGESIWGFAEVLNDAAARQLVDAAADPGSDQVFDYVFGTTGYEDHLVLAWDDTRFALEQSVELDEINVSGSVRSPLVGYLRDRETGIPFTVVVNHLFRSDEDARHEQARLLNDWGATEPGAVVMIGDYNFDWEVETGEHDQGYDELVAGGVFEWIQPSTMLKSQCSSFYDSVLDFVFVGGDAQGWPADAEILYPEEGYCHGHIDTWPDHRPMAATFTAIGR
ncbi:MAG: endonuclease/exonuclease/phosphatase [Myxococcota bacterium]